MEKSEGQLAEFSGRTGDGVCVMAAQDVSNKIEGENLNQCRGQLYCPPGLESFEADVSARINLGKRLSNNAADVKV
ncbi:hypothetical protein CEXT_20331 [Caerostris extrusa]|uniref:Uncharacterized protein n=1 Tax=Caerostris extrusa TaxID=172846 RepID=A0AAV4TCU9_CAEEX|nr:hypothetical protein CEXT_20331 [Caerostris extrusa]